MSGLMLRLQMHLKYFTVVFALLALFLVSGSVLVDAAVTVTGTSLYTLRLDTLSAYPGSSVTYYVILENPLPVKGFNVIFHYDPSVLTLTNVSTEGTRASSFETFTSQLDVNGVKGDVRVVGSTSGLLAAGSGAIVRVSFRLSPDANFAGMEVPIRFIFPDRVTYQDNTLLDTLGAIIEQSQMVYYDGYIYILTLGDVKIGDINLNKLAFEIGDAIYFINYIINPALYPFNTLQYLNSDINGDKYTATVADLVLLINTIVNDNVYTGKTSMGIALTSEIIIRSDSESMEFVSKADFEVGAVLLVVETDGNFDLQRLRNLTDNMILDIHQQGKQLRMLLYSLDGEHLPSGEVPLVAIEGAVSASVQAVEIGSADGRMVEVTVTAAVSPATTLPESCVLKQNYPNPFNPATRIEFDLPQAGRVELAVYNILGEKIRILIDEILPAGSHCVEWDSRDDSGQVVASGIYFYRLSAEADVLSRKMMLVK